MPISRHTFTHLDTDTDHAARRGGDFDGAVNIALGPGYVTAQPGNVLVPYTLSPNGTTRSLGAIADGATGTAIAFLCNSAGFHRLVRYDPQGNAGAGSNETLLEWAGLNLANELVLQGAVLDGLLVYLGADGYLRSVNLARLASGYYTPQVLADNPYCLHLVKTPPTTSRPTARRLAGTSGDTREQLRIIQRKAYQFAVRWNYLDGEQTVLSPYSDWVDVLEDPSTTALNTIAVTLPAAPSGVSEVEVLVREPDSDGWVVADSLRPNAVGKLPTSYTFYGVTSGTSVTAAEASRLFEAEWPGKVVVAARNRLLKANLTEGYLTPSAPFTAEIVQGNGSITTATRYGVAVTTETPNPNGGNPITESGTYYYVQATGTYPDPASTYFVVEQMPTGSYISEQTATYDAAFVQPYPNEVNRYVITFENATFVDRPDTSDVLTFHENSTYRVAMQFYDAQGKPFGVGKDVSVYVPPRPKGDRSYRSIQVELASDPAVPNQYIPAEAYSYQFLVARNDRTTYFLQGQAADCFAYLGHTTTIKADETRVESEQLLDVIHTPHQKVWVDIGNFPAAGLGYVWQPGSGDVLRFLNENKEFVITNQVGDYLEVQWDGYPAQSIDATGQTVARIEIYAPNLTPSPIFYERGPRLPVVRQVVAGQEQRSYGQVRVRLEGDCFLVTLNFPQLDKGLDKDNDKNYQPPLKKSWLPADSAWSVLVESMVPPYRLVPATTLSQTIYDDRTRGGFFKRLLSKESGENGIGGAFSYIFGGELPQPANSTTIMVNAGRGAANFTWLDVSYGGRPGVQVPRALQRVVRSKTLRFSGVKVGGTLLNGLSRWEALSQYDELPQEQGAVTACTVADQVAAEGSIVLVNQERGDESLSLGQTRLQTADDQPLLAISRQVIGGSNALRGAYGCLDPASVVGYAGKVFFWCGRRAELLRYDRNGLTPLGTTYKVRTRLEAVARAYAGATVRGCFHPRIDRKEYYLTFGAIGELPSLTLVYSELYQAWSDELSCHPEAGTALGNELLSWQAGQLWRHSLAAPAATFYDGYVNPSLTFTVAQPGGVSKQFKDVAVESPALWLPTALATDTRLRSRTYPAWFTFREGIWRTGLRQASNTPGFTDVFRALDNGLPLIGSNLRLTLTAPPEAQPLTACSVSMLPRTGQGMGV